MKKMLLLLLFVCGLSHSQNTFQGKVYYKASLKKPNLKSEKITEEIKRIIKNTKDVDFILLFDHEKSEYKKLEKMNIEEGSKINMSQILGGGSDMYYTFSSKKEKPFFKKERGGDLFLINYKKTEWELKQETKKIDKYICYKAIDKNIENKPNYKHTTVWYIPSLPISYGPKNFHNLPGLVVEVNTGSFSLIAYKIEINLKNKIEITIPKEGLKISKKEYFKKVSSFFKKSN